MSIKRVDGEFIGHFIADLMVLMKIEKSEFARNFSKMRVSLDNEFLIWKSPVDRSYYFQVDLCDLEISGLEVTGWFCSRRKQLNLLLRKGEEISMKFPAHDMFDEYLRNALAKFSMSAGVRKVVNISLVNDEISRSQVEEASLDLNKLKELSSDILKLVRVESLDVSSRRFLSLDDLISEILDSESEHGILTLHEVFCYVNQCLGFRFMRAKHFKETVSTLTSGNFQVLNLVDCVIILSNKKSGTEKIFGKIMDLLGTGQSVLEISIRLRLSLMVCQCLIDDLESNQGRICRDDSPSGRFYFRNLFSF